MFEEKERGSFLYLIFCDDSLIVIRIEFCNLHSACVFSSQFIQEWYHGSGRRTPRSPAAHDNRTGKRQYLVVKIAVGYVIRIPLIKGHTALTTNGPMMEPFFLDDIFCSARQASQNKFVKMCSASSAYWRIADMISRYPVLLPASETSYNEVVYYHVFQSTNDYLYDQDLLPLQFVV